MHGMKNYKIFTGQLYAKYEYRFRRVKLYSRYSPSRPSWSVLGLTLPFSVEQDNINLNVKKIKFDRKNW
jgi:hypothetical protein